MPSRRRLLAAAPLSLLAGCATRFYADDLPETKPRLQVQNPGLNPSNGGVAIDAQLLQPGDILLSSANGMTSVGIRMLTLSPVSHACLYVGNEEVAEAVGEGIRRRSVAALLDEESTVVAFRHPGVRPEHLEKMRAFVLETVGTRYNYV